jgi:hypothetical protein
VTLALTGSSDGENRVLKSDLLRSGAQHKKNPDFTGASFPPHFLTNSGKSQGNPVVEMAPPKGTNNLTEGTNKNGRRVKRMSNLK